LVSSRPVAEREAAAGVGAGRGRRVTKAWAVTYGLFFLLLVAFFAGFVLLEMLRLVSLRSALVLAAVFVVGLVAVMVAGFRKIRDATTPPEYREVRVHGLTATATVLELERTGWRTGGGLDLRLRVRRKRWEYTLRLRVTDPVGGAYEARTTAYLAGEEIPEVGDRVGVKVHPQRPDVVLMDVGC
jgi:hypothetical protein